MQTSTEVTRYLHIDSDLVPVVNGSITVAVPDPYSNVSRITLREALIPRTDDLLYVLLGIRLNGGDRPSLMQLGANPTSARTQNSNKTMAPSYYSVTKVTPHLPVFCQLPVGDATSVTSLNASALNVNYSFVDHRMDDMWSYAIQPPVRSLSSITLQLYRPPDASSTYDLPVYDISVFKITFAAPLTVPPGTDITSTPASDQIAQPQDFTATILAIDPSDSTTALVGSFSSLTAFQAFVTRTAEDGVTRSEQSLFTADASNTPVGLVSSPAQVTSLATRVLLTLELPVTMVPAPKPPTGRKPRTAPRKSPVKEGSQKPRSQQGRPEDNPHFVQITVVAPSCAQRVYWTGQDFGWPLNSKHACMNCCHTFKGPPVGLPVHYDERSDMFRLWGNYCSFNCCKRYIMDTRRSDTSHLIDNLALLGIKVHKQNAQLRAAPKHYKGILTAPPKTALQMFGGGLTIEEFRRNSVRVTDVLAKEPFVKMSWPDAILAVKGNGVHNLQANAPEKSAAAKPFAVGRAAPLRKNNTLDAFLKG